jgi:uncharacterized protein with von Willebrand factor type A (vWA) domain
MKDLAALVALTLHILVSERYRGDLVEIVLADGTGDLAVHGVSDANMDDQGCRILVKLVAVEHIKPQEQ